MSSEARSLDAFSTMSVLIVDDNPGNVALLEGVLADAGLTRVTALTDSRLVEGLLPAVNPDLVLLDLRMPFLDGYGVLALVSRFAAGTYLPVLVLTADPGAESRDRALSHGARDFITKPFDNSEVVLRVGNLLETRDLYSSIRRPPVGTPNPIQRKDRMKMEDRIQSVLFGGGITPVYQPVVDVTSGLNVGYEALARFPHPHQRGPAGWFEDAFTSGLGVELEWLAATQQIVAMGAPGAGSGFLAVNMSPATILRLEDHILGDPTTWSRLVVELTEHSPIEEYTPIHRALRAMRDAGTRLAADDLGAGYAGFRHLLHLSPDIIKLDISLVGGIDRSRAQRALASALVAFAHDVGVTVIGEGVERAEEMDVLRDLGVQWAQGFHLGRPAPAPSRAGIPPHVGEGVR